MSSVITKKLNKTAKEMEILMQKSKRKLLEFEVAISIAEIKIGNSDIFKTAQELVAKSQK